MRYENNKQCHQYQRQYSRYNIHLLVNNQLMTDNIHFYDFNDLDVIFIICFLQLILLTSTEQQSFNRFTLFYNTEEINIEVVTLQLESGEKVDYFAYGADYYQNNHFVSHYRIPLNNWSTMHYNELEHNGVAYMLDQRAFTSSYTQGSLALVQYVKISTLPQTVQRQIRESFNS